MRKKKLIATVLAATIIFTTGCTRNQASTNDNQQQVAANEKIGTLLVSVNPEIEIAYDSNGKVLTVEGLNQNGSNIMLSLTDYEGKSVKEVVSTLIDLIYNNGYFNETINGQSKNVILKFEADSKYPNDEFAKELTSTVETALANHKLSGTAMVIDADDYQKNGYISEEKAKEIVLAQVGLKEATFTEHEYDLTDGVYEFEFYADGKEYEYEVSATTGKVMEADVENHDWDAYHTDHKTTQTDATGTTKTEATITKERAKEIALEKAGITNATFTKEEYDASDNDYEFEFYADGKEYDCEVNAVDGRINDFEVKTQNTR